MGRTEQETPSLTNIALSSDKERVDVFRFDEFIRLSFPHLADSEVPKFIGKITDIIAPDCLINPLESDYSHEKSSHAFLRGSTVKRHLLGTPKGYWDVSRLYQDYQRTQEINSPTAYKIVDNLTSGPYDVDIRYVGNSKESRNNIRKSIHEYLFNNGFVSENETDSNYTRNDGYSVKIKNHVVGTIKDPVAILDIRFYKEGVFQLKLDLGDVGRLENPSNIRLDALTSSRMDFISTVCLTLTPEGSVVVIDAFEMAQRHFEEMFHIRGSWGKYEKSFYATQCANTVRQINEKLLWPSPFDPRYGYHTDLNLYDFINNARNEYKDKEIPLSTRMRKRLRKREKEIMSDYMLGLTYDPVLFITLGHFFRGKLFKYTPFGEIVKSEDDIRSVLESLCELIGVSPNDKIANVTEEYHKKILTNPDARLEDTGVILIIKALKMSGHLPENYPETVEASIRLFNPARRFCRGGGN